MKKNDIFEIEITDMGVDGEGIGKYEGMTFFIKDALIGDVIRAKVVKLKKNYGYARVEEVITPSAFRVEPKCVHHRRCGGCQIQALSYEKQLEFKNQKVRGNLIRIGGFSEEEIDKKMLPIVGMEEPFRYRNKAQFPVGIDKEGNIVTGFYAARTHSIIPIEDCLLGVSQNAPILEEIKAWMKENHILVYNETTGKGLLRHVLIRFGFTTKEIMVCLIINGKKLPQKEALIEKLAKIEGMTSISINSNMQNTNVILGDVTKCIWGQPFITDYIHLRKCGSEWNEQLGTESLRENVCKTVEDLSYEKILREKNGTEDLDELEKRQVMEDVCEKAEKSKNKKDSESRIKDEFALTDTAVAYRISPQSFYQVNPIQTEKLYSTALEYAQLTGNEYVWDLYCGIGTISLFLAQKAKKVYGVEIVPQAIADAKENAKLNGIINAEFFLGKAEEVLPEFYKALQAGNEYRTNNTVAHLHKQVEKADYENLSSCEELDNDKNAMLHPDVIVVDPPRKGCDDACLNTMIQMQPKRIVYVSCDSATLARDLRVLCDGGYEIKKVRAFDQFGHTTHVETVVALQRMDT